MASSKPQQIPLKELSLSSVRLGPASSGKIASFSLAFSIHCYTVGLQLADTVSPGLYTFCHGWLHFSELFLLPSLNLNKKGLLKNAKDSFFKISHSLQFFKVKALFLSFDLIPAAKERKGFSCRRTEDINTFEPSRTDQKKVPAQPAKIGSTGPVV